MSATVFMAMSCLHIADALSTVCNDRHFMGILSWHLYVSAQ